MPDLGSSRHSYQDTLYPSTLYSRLPSACLQNLAPKQLVLGQLFKLPGNSAPLAFVWKLFMLRSLLPVKASAVSSVVFWPQRSLSPHQNSCVVFSLCSCSDFYEAQLFFLLSSTPWSGWCSCLVSPLGQACSLPLTVLHKIWKVCLSVQLWASKKCCLIDFFL